MTVRKITLYLVVAAALCAGVAMRNKSAGAMRFRQGVVRGLTSFFHNDNAFSESEKELLRSFYEREQTLVKEELLDLRLGPQEEMLAYANERPDRPERLWRWLAGEPSRVKDAGFSPVPPPKTPYTDANRAAVTKLYRFMRDRDPNNGWPLVQLAYLAASRSVRYEFPKGEGKPQQIRVTDTESMAEAVALLHEAAGKGKITVYARESINNEFAIVGNPETFEDGLAGYRLADHLADGLTMYTLWSLDDFFSAEAGRRLETATDREEKRSAYAILHDLQTVGALVVVDAASQDGQSNGFLCIANATEAGVALLNRFGLEAEAEMLLARGVALARPYVVSRLARFSTGDEIWHKVAGLGDEARRTAQRLEKMEKSAIADSLDAASFMVSMSAPFYREFLPAGEKFLTLENIQASTNFESWSREKEWSSLLSIVAWSILAMLLIMAGIDFLVAKRPLPETAWPSPVQVLAGSLIFAVSAVAPGFLVASIGFRGDMFNAWLHFWNVWGFFAGIALLWMWAYSRSEVELGEATPIRFWPRGNGQLLAVAGIAIALPVAVAGVFSRELAGLAILLLFPAFFHGMLFPLRWLLGALKRAAGPSAARRLVLAGWAGGCCCGLPPGSSSKRRRKNGAGGITSFCRGRSTDNITTTNRLRRGKRPRIGLTCVPLWMGKSIKIF